MDKKVVVLLSTYNGEKYIKEQIDSILSQTYPNIKIIVRDDGSKDETISILKQYEKNHQIELHLGENKGFIDSFIELLNMEEADYYSFADQDDIWKKEKIQRAIEQLELQDFNKPQLYCSNYEICDENGNFVAKHKSAKNISFANSLVECIAPGMTMVINHKARQLLLAKNMHLCYYHDWWMYLVCISMGNVIYDEFESVLYRRHKETVTNRENNLIKFQIWRLKQIFLNDYFKKTKQQIKSFYQEYKTELSEDNRKIILRFISSSIKNTIQKITYLKPYRNGILDEILIRILFIFQII